MLRSFRQQEGDRSMSVELTRAEPFAAPVVESHSVRLLVDSFYDRFIEDAGHPLVKIEHVRHIPGRKRSTFAGEWGLSLHLESAQAGGKSRYLLDFGYTPEVLIRNFELLDLDPRPDRRPYFEPRPSRPLWWSRGVRHPLSSKNAPGSQALRRRRGQLSREVDQTARRRTGVLGYARPQDAGGRRRRYGVL